MSDFLAIKQATQALMNVIGRASIAGTFYLEDKSLYLPQCKAALMELGRLEASLRAWEERDKALAAERDEARRNSGDMATMCYAQHVMDTQLGHAKGYVEGWIAARDLLVDQLGRCGDRRVWYVYEKCIKMFNKKLETQGQ